MLASGRTVGCDFSWQLAPPARVREAAQRTVGPAGQERRKQVRRDPPNGRVLTLMMADGKALPRDLDTKKYKVLVRFVKK